MVEEKVYSNPYVTKIVGISPQSGVNWANCYFPDLETDASGRKVYRAEHIEFYKKVKKLSNQGLKHEQIKEKLADDLRLITEGSQPKSLKNVIEELSAVNIQDLSIECDSVTDFILKSFLESDPHNSRFAWIFKKAINLEKRNALLEEENKRLLTK